MALRRDTELRTARLSLHPCTLGDLDQLHALFIHPDVRRYLWDDREITREVTRGAIEASLASFTAKGFGQWLVFVPDDPVLGGFCELRPLDGRPEPELLYALARERWGAGFATEAAEAVLLYAFDGLGLERVAARVDAPNRASLRVLERVGMRFERDTTIDGRSTLEYFMTRETFRKPRGSS